MTQLSYFDLLLAQLNFRLDQERHIYFCAARFLQVVKVHDLLFSHIQMRGSMQSVSVWSSFAYLRTK